MATAKEEFLKEFGEHYGYPNSPKTIDQIRAAEFNRLQSSFIHYSFSYIYIYIKFLSTIRLFISYYHFFVFKKLVIAIY